MFKKLRDNQRGQALVITAISLVLLVAISGLAIDAGRAYVDRRSLQSAADTAADAGARMLVGNYKAQSQSPPAIIPYSDSTISTEIANVMKNTYSDGSGYTSYVATYTDAQGNDLVNTVGGGTLPPSCPPPVAGQDCAGGVHIVPSYTHKTLFLGAVGLTNATEKANAVATFTAVQNVNASDLMPFGIWHVNCIIDGSPTPDASASDPYLPGDRVVLDEAQWLRNEAGCGNGNNATSNDFKGYFHNNTTLTGAACSGTSVTTYTDGMDFCTFGGVAKGLAGSQQATFDAAAAGHYPLIFPVIDQISGNGQYTMNVVGFIAIIPDGGGALSGTVVSVVLPLSGFQGCLNPGGCPPPGPNVPILVQLLK